MKYRFTILNVPAILFILVGIIFSTINYAEMSTDGGLAVVGMIGLFAYAACILLVDVIIQRLITSRVDRIKLSVIILLAVLGSLFLT